MEILSVDKSHFSKIGSGRNNRDLNLSELNTDLSKSSVKEISVIENKVKL